MKFLTIITSLFFAIPFQGQVSRYVMGSGGGQTTLNNGMVVMFNIGEAIINTLEATNVRLTQGFEQAPYRLSEVYNFNPATAFSPDGDGVNEIWILPLSPSLTLDNQVQILNKWGNIVRLFINYNNLDVVWDGTDENGNPVDPGTYYYTISIGGKKSGYSGWVQIVR